MLNSLLYYLPLLICPICMGLMMWIMGRTHMRGHDQVVSHQQAVVNPTERLATLHAQRAALEAEIAILANMTEQEDQCSPMQQQAQLVHASR